MTAWKKHQLDLVEEANLASHICDHGEKMA
jgi:hypothetical protein